MSFIWVPTGYKAVVTGSYFNNSTERVKDLLLSLLDQQNNIRHLPFWFHSIFVFKRFSHHSRLQKFMHKRVAWVKSVCWLTLIDWINVWTCFCVTMWYNWHGIWINNNDSQNSHFYLQKRRFLPQNYIDNIRFFTSWYRIMFINNITTYM